MKVVLISHGDLCHGLKKTLEMFVSVDDVITVSLNDAGVEEFDINLATVLEKDDEYLVLSDIEGGSPYQTALKYKLEGSKKIEIVSGLNLPMAIEAVICKETVAISDLADQIANTAISSIKKFEIQIKKNVENE